MAKPSGSSAAATANSIPRATARRSAPRPFPGYVRIKGTKGSVKSMDLYTRLKGQPGWKVAIARRSKFPWDDDSALAQPGVPETREYRAIGVLDDKEIGQPSDIVEVVYAG